MDEDLDDIIDDDEAELTEQAMKALEAGFKISFCYKQGELIIEFEGLDECDNPAEEKAYLLYSFFSDSHEFLIRVLTSIGKDRDLAREFVKLIKSSRPYIDAENVFGKPGGVSDA